MPTTSNFGWTTPADTDLVKDGAAAIRTLGNGIDTSLVDLKGGTTNQVLAKNSNTDLDFKWVADASGIPATIFDAKGDIIAATAADTADRLAVGTNGHVLTADSSTATGLKWAAPAASGLTWTLVNSPSGTALTSGQTVTVSGLNYEYLMIIVDDARLSSTNNVISVVFNSETGVYQVNGMYTQRGSTYAINDVQKAGLTYSIDLGGIGGSTSGGLSGYCFLSGGKSTTNKIIQAAGMASPASSATPYGYVVGGVYNATAATTSVSLRTFSAGHTFTNGTLWVYGA